MSKKSPEQPLKTAARVLDFISEVSSTKKVPPMNTPKHYDNTPPPMYAEPKSDEGGDDYEPLPAKGGGVRPKQQPRYKPP